LRRSSSEFIRFWERGIGDLGLVAQLFREVKRQFSRLFNRFRKKPGENVEEVPAQWMKQKDASPGTEKWRPKGSRKVRVEKKGSRFLIVKPTRRLYHWRWLRQIKRLIAGLLLCVNFFIAEFILGTTPGALILFFLFFLNSFILVDYLWKTMKRKEE